MITEVTGLRFHELPGSVHSPKWWAPFMNDNPLLHCSCPAVYIHGLDGKWL
ncbi:unnamed protein product, partial [Staurois parvus]